MLPQSNNKYMLLTSNIQIYFIISVLEFLEIMGKRNGVKNFTCFDIVTNQLLFNT